jgi:hypothetical protein
MNPPFLVISVFRKPVDSASCQRHPSANDITPRGTRKPTVGETVKRSTQNNDAVIEDCRSHHAIEGQLSRETEAENCGLRGRLCIFKPAESGVVDLFTPDLEAD